MKLRHLFARPSRRYAIAAVGCMGAALVLAGAGNAAYTLLPLACVVAAAGFAAAALLRCHGAHRLTPADQEPASRFALSKKIEEEVKESSDGVDLSVLGAQASRRQWQEIEGVVDGILDACISAVRSRINGHTIALFFPSSDGGYRLRRFDSPSDCINRDAVIYPGVGVIGSFLKGGLKQLNLHEIVSDSMTLYYYTRDAGIRSLMASPIMAAGVERGVIIVDSMQERHFTDEDHSYLAVIAGLCGQAVYYAYLYNENRIRYARFTAVASIEKYFFQKHDVEAVLDKMAEIIPYAVPCDRLSISLREPDGSSAAVRRARGAGAEAFAGRRFSLKEKSLAALLYDKNICFFRNFSPDRYETRYCDNEPRAGEFVSFLAYPLGVDECRGGILLESTRPDAFTEYHRAILSRFATSAGLALEKIFVLEQARNLATHDGLTGLNNHRQFQKLLRDEITRASRYNDPLALVLCDVDLFKKINDTHGHQFGDVVLRGVAACFQGNIRDSVDIAARYGGEEFAFILVKSGAPQAQETAERIRQQVASLRFTTPQGETVSVTMSFGIAVYGEHTRHTDALIQKADKALYRAKAAGRNRVEVF